MKRVVTVAVVVLLVWNIFLTVELFGNHKVSTVPSGDDNQTVENHVVNSFTTDITTLVSENESKVVCVTTVNTDNKVVKTGSGIIYSSIDNNVYIVTNEHVISGDNKINVLFDSGDVLEAELVGSDVYSDLALLVCQPDFAVTPFKMGDSSLVKKGEYVVAIGSPMGADYQGTVSFGIISGINRTIDIDINNDGVDDWDLVMLQTDAAINEGNSGGPLINLSGELIGLTTVKLASSEGMSFAIPSNEMVTIVDELMDNHEVSRPIFGISGRSVSDLTVYQKSYLGISIDTTTGVIISEVMEGSPASKSGLQADDVITKIGDVSIDSFKTFRKEIYNYDSGATVSITFTRNNQESTVSVTLE